MVWWLIASVAINISLIVIIILMGLILYQQDNDFDY